MQCYTISPTKPSRPRMASCRLHQWGLAMCPTRTAGSFGEWFATTARCTRSCPTASAQTMKPRTFRVFAALGDVLRLAVITDSYAGQEDEQTAGDGTSTTTDTTTATSMGSTSSSQVTSAYSISSIVLSVWLLV